MTKLTVKDLFEKKGKQKLTELYVTNSLEAHASEEAGIDILIVSFKKETLRTGVPTNRWFRDAHISDIRNAAPNTFFSSTGTSRKALKSSVTKPFLLRYCKRNVSASSKLVNTLAST